MALQPQMPAPAFSGCGIILCKENFSKKLNQFSYYTSNAFSKTKCFRVFLYLRLGVQFFIFDRLYINIGLNNELSKTTNLH